MLHLLYFKHLMVGVSAPGVFQITSAVYTRVEAEGTRKGNKTAFKHLVIKRTRLLKCELLLSALGAGDGRIEALERLLRKKKRLVVIHKRL